MGKGEVPFRGTVFTNLTGKTELPPDNDTEWRGELDAFFSGVSKLFKEDSGSIKRALEMLRGQ